MSDLVANAAPRLVLLLLLSPWIGVLTVWLAGRQSPTSLRRAVLINAAVTAALATLLTLFDAWVPAQAGDEASGWGFYALRAVWAPPDTTAATAARFWTIHIGFSIGIDSLNAGQLLWIPWLTLAVLLSTTEGQSQGSGYFAGLLALEGFLLLVFAAQDALTFCLGAESAILLTWLLTGWYGGDERRGAAEKYQRSQHTGQLFWMAGLVGLALAATWAQQELRIEAPPVSFGWNELAHTLPRLVSRYVSSFQYWDHAASGLLLLLLIGTVLRGGLVPLHGWLPALVQEASPALGVLQLGVGGLIGSYGFLRFVAPLVQVNSYAAHWLMFLGAATALLGSLLTLAQSDLRRFSVFWWLSVQGSLWVGLASGIPSAQRASWLALQSAAAAAAGWLLLTHFLEQRYRTRQMSAYGGLAAKFPRMALVASVCLLSLMGVPAVARGLAEGWVHLSLLSLQSSWWWVSMAGVMLTGWATVWCFQQLFFGELREPAAGLEGPYDGAALDPDTPLRDAAWSGDSNWSGRSAPQLLVVDLTFFEVFALAITVIIPLAPWWASQWRGVP